MSDNSTLRRRSRKAASLTRQLQPYKGFPLSAHPAGYWQKKINGKVYYFGRWGRVVNKRLEQLPDGGWKAALALYEQQREDRYAGRTPRTPGAELTIRGLCNQFLTAKQQLLTTGEITARTFADYKSTTDRLVRVFGLDRPVDDLAAADFASLRADIAKTRGPVSLGNEIQRARTIFKLAYDNALIEKPIRYGQGFNKPSRKVLRKAKAANGVRLFAAAEIRKMLDAAGAAMRAMIMLGVNCGFGNADCGTLPMSAVDLESGWVNYPRPKTGIDRRCPLWPETVKALREAIAQRPEHKHNGHAELVFITKYGDAWAKDSPDSPVCKETIKLLDELKLHRPGLGFYTLRHTFRTVADATRDFPAIDLIMGHCDATMGGHYREKIDNTRLTAVTKHVRKWLFGGKGGAV